MPDDDHEPAANHALSQEADADDELYNTVIVRGLDPEGRATDMGDLAPRDQIMVFGISMPRSGVQNVLSGLPFVSLVLPFLAIVGMLEYPGNIGIARIGTDLACVAMGAGPFALPFSVASRNAFGSDNYSSAITLAVFPGLAMVVVVLAILTFQ